MTLASGSIQRENCSILPRLFAPQPTNLKRGVTRQPSSAVSSRQPTESVKTAQLKQGSSATGRLRRLSSFAALHVGSCIGTLVMGAPFSPSLSAHFNTSLCFVPPPQKDRCFYDRMTPPLRRWSLATVGCRFTCTRQGTYLEEDGTLGG